MQAELPLMFIFKFGKKGSFGRPAAMLAGFGLMAISSQAQTSLTSPGLYDGSTTKVNFAARGSLEFNPPTRANVWVIGPSIVYAKENKRATNPWASVLGEAQSFELNYNRTTGDLSWTLLGTTLNTNVQIEPGYGMSYLLPMIKVQTPDGAADNLGQLSNLTVSVNGGAAQTYGPWNVAGNNISSTPIFFTEYDANTVKVTGDVMFDIPEAWSTNVNGTYFDIAIHSAQPVPEPATLAAVGVGLIALRRRRKR